MYISVPPRLQLLTSTARTTSTATSLFQTSFIIILHINILYQDVIRGKMLSFLQTLWTGSGLYVLVSNALKTKVLNKHRPTTKTAERDVVQSVDRLTIRPGLAGTVPDFQRCHSRFTVCPGKYLFDLFSTLNSIGTVLKRGVENKML